MPPANPSLLVLLFIRASTQLFDVYVTLGDQRNDEADECEGLDECGAQDEDREQTALHLRLARDGRRGAISRKTNADAGADNTKTITDSSHDSSFVSRPTSCSSGDS